MRLIFVNYSMLFLCLIYDIIYTDQNKSKTNSGGNGYEVQQKRDYEKSMGDQERECEQHFRIVLENGVGNRKKAAEEKELPELQGSVKQIAWAKDIREKIIAKLDMGNLLTNRGELMTEWAEDFMGRKFLLTCVTFLDKTDWAKKLTEKKEQLFGKFSSVYPKYVGKNDPRREAYRAMRLRTNRLYAEYVHELGLEFVSSLTKATDFIDRRRYV